MYKILDKSKKGMSLVIILIIFALIAIIGTTMLTMSVAQSSQTSHGIYYDKAYYLARSGVEVVAKDLKDRFDNLSYLKSQIVSATKEEVYVQRLAAYNDALDFINNNIIGHTVALTNINGYVADQVQISNEENIVYIQSVKNVENATAKAKVKFATHSSISIPVTVDDTKTITTTAGDDAFYTWGNMNIINNAWIDGNISHTGTATFNKTPDKIGTDNTVDAYPIHIQAPPASIWNAATPPLPATFPISGKVSTSGYYKANYGNNAIEWTVDTSAGDVSLVFNSISSDKASSIVVTGPNNLYIYLLQEDDTTKPLIYMKNDFIIKNQNPSDTTPHTYIISYDKRMRDNTYLGVNSYIDINNCPEMQAFFYMPYTNVEIKNNFTMSGCMYAANIDIKNNLQSTYVAPNDLNFGANNVTPHTEKITTPVTHSFNYEQYVVNKIWVK